MTIIDQKGRLFGKVNLLDLAIVLIVLAVGGRFAYGYINKGEGPPASEARTVEVQFLLGGVRDKSVKLLQVRKDDPVKVYDSKSGSYLGVIVAVETVPAKNLNDQGKEVDSLIKFDHVITVRGDGRVSDNGVTLGGIEMKVGRAQDLRTADWAGSPVIWEINKNPDLKK